MSKKEILVLRVTPEAEASYLGNSVGFYDNPRTITIDGKEVTQDRLYIRISLVGGRTVSDRLAEEDELLKYRRAYELYLAAKAAGGKLDTTTQLIESLAEKNKAIEKAKKEAASKDTEIEELRKQLVIQQEEAKKNLK